MENDDFESALSFAKDYISDENALKLTISDYPHLKEESRRKIYKALVITNSSKKEKVMTTEEFFRVIG